MPPAPPAPVRNVGSKISKRFAGSEPEVRYCTPDDVADNQRSLSLGILSDVLDGEGEHDAGSCPGRWEPVGIAHSPASPSDRAMGLGETVDLRERCVELAAPAQPRARRDDDRVGLTLRDVAVNDEHVPTHSALSLPLSVARSK
jgi:hypothetical protein